MSYYVILCHIMSYYVILCHIMSYDVIFIIHTIVTYCNLSCNYGVSPWNAWYLLGDPVVRFQRSPDLCGSLAARGHPGHPGGTRGTAAASKEAADLRGISRRNLEISEDFLPNQGHPGTLTRTWDQKPAKKVGEGKTHSYCFDPEMGIYDCSTTRLVASFFRGLKQHEAAHF